MNSAKQDQEQKIDAAKKVLGEPFATELSEVGWKVRNHLFISSIISIIYVLAKLHIEPDSTLLGLKFSGLNDQVLQWGLLGINIYFTSHFIWLSVDGFIEWRLRITGTRQAFITAGTFGSEDADYTSNPRQSTLYNWWLKRSSKDWRKEIDHIIEARKLIEDLESTAKKQFSSGVDASNISSNFMQPLATIRNKLTEFESAINHAEKIISSPRIIASLERFDNWFHLFCRSQNLRWLLIDLVLPILIASYSIILLVMRLIGLC